MASPTELRRAIEKCDRFLSRHPRRSISESLAALTAEAKDSDRVDVYGHGGVIEDFERQLATLLGKPAAVFMPSGTMAQQIALRIHCDRSGIASVAYHPTSHLELHEQKGLLNLHGISSRLCGAPSKLMTATDLAAMPGDISTLLVELPQREIGGALPTWSELTALLGVASGRKMTTHLDGARLWECEPYYRRPPKEICALFNSVYVSFYKVLGGIAGAVLAGEADFIAEARLWQRRYGGNLVHLYPYVLSARAGLRAHRGKMAEYVERAQSISTVLSAIDGVSVSPSPVVTNMMHVYIAAPPHAVERECLSIARQDRVALFGALLDCTTPNTARFEVSIGQAAKELSDVELSKWFTRLAKAK